MKCKRISNYMYFSEKFKIIFKEVNIYTMLESNLKSLRHRLGLKQDYVQSSLVLNA